MTEGLTYREGAASDLRETFTICQLAANHTALGMGVPGVKPPSEDEIEQRWEQEREMIGFIAAQSGCYWICEDEGKPVGYARTARFGEMEELSELMVLPSHHRRGIGRSLLERCWPDDPTPDLGRVVVAAGAPADLTLYTAFGVMPTAGHWHLRADVAAYQEMRSHEIDVAEPAVVALAPPRAVGEWKRLEPPAVAHRRPLLHEFFGRTRTCLATMDEESGHASALCWIGPAGEIGPAVGATPEDLVPVVLQALDRVAKTREPDTFGIFCSTDSWWLLRRLGRLGFRIFWPSWVMCSVPLPGLDRYVPTRPAHLL